jgi:Sap, sulfolipid-1-addressing protein
MPSPKRLMLGYLLGAMLTSVTLGLIIVFALADSHVVRTAETTVNPAVDLALAALFLTVAAVIGTGRDKRFTERRGRHRAVAGRPAQPPRWQRALGTGSPRITFVVGALLTLPGASYLAALGGVSKLDLAVAPTVALVVMVNVVMLALIELPLASFTLEPEWTPSAVARARGWFALHGRTIVFAGTSAIGGLLLLRAVVTFAS